MATPRTCVAVAGAMLALLVACGGPESTPPPSTTPPTTSAQPTGSAPQVEDPLDGDAFAEKPCSSLTATQLDDLELGPGNEGDGDGPVGLSTNCTFADRDPATELVVYLDFYPGVDTGLSYRYDQHADGDWPQWTPTDVDGYPAVFYSAKDPAPDPTACDLAVGITDALAFNVRLFYYRHVGYTDQDTCAMTKTIAQAVVTTIKG